MERERGGGQRGKLGKSGEEERKRTDRGSEVMGGQG